MYTFIQISNVQLVLGMSGK